MSGRGGGDGGQPNWHRAALRSVTVVGLVLMTGACASSGSAMKPIGADRTTPTSPVASTSTSTTVTEPPTTSVKATEAAVLAAYRASGADTAAVEGHFPVDEFNPILADHMSGDELNRVRNYATLLNHLGQYVAGPAPDTSMAVVKRLAAKTALVVDCGLDGTVLMEGRTTRVVKPAGGSRRTLVDARVDLVEGIWKVTAFNIVSDGCTSSS